MDCRLTLVVAALGLVSTVVGIVVFRIMTNRRSAIIADGTDDANRAPTVEDGYGWLNTRAANALTRLQSIQIAEIPQIVADDEFFRPIQRTFSQGVVQCLLSALDHLRFLVWSLQSRTQPYPYAQATLIRTAITGAATALWMVSGSTPNERRCRALEFNFNDLSSQLSWMNTAASQEQNKKRPPEEWATFEAQREEVANRIEWIVQQANSLLTPPTPFTRRTYRQRLTSDTEMVETAGAYAPAIGMGGWDPGTTLLSTWRVLSGYAHARPWASTLGSTLIVRDPTPHPVTGTITVSAVGNPDRLLDFAFRAIIVAEAGIGWLEQMSSLTQ